MQKFIAHLQDEKSRFVCEPAGKEFASLKKFYSLMNGGLFYVHGNYAGIFIPPINGLARLNKSVREWLFDESEAPIFQREGFAF